jgi:hypothetical protein
MTKLSDKVGVEHGTLDVVMRVTRHAMPLTADEAE